MKKIMIAAAAVALAGVVFADGQCGTPVYCGYAYRVKLSGKTVTGKSATTGSTKTCDLETSCWAKPASYRVAGYIYGFTTQGPADCEECACNALADNIAIFWNADKEQVFSGIQSVTFDVYDILRNGGSKNKAQIAFKLEGLQCAGFGTYNPNTQKLKSANGFFAGTLTAPLCGGAYDSKTCTYGNPTVARVFKPCALTEAVDATDAIAFGRWSFTYKADKVAQLEKDGDETIFQPTGFQARN